jgi:hypothetical protein
MTLNGAYLSITRKTMCYYNAFKYYTRIMLWSACDAQGAAAWGRTGGKLGDGQAGRLRRGRFVIEIQPAVVIRDM